MDRNNELVEEKNWIKRNWKWSLPTVILFLLVSAFIFTSNNAEDLANVAQAYSENSLYEKAIEKANTNPKVTEIIGKIHPIDKLAIMEGDVVYSNGNNSVRTTLRFNGDKESGKIDIVANKIGAKWEYKKITVRLKNPKTVIDVLKSI